MKKSGSLSHLRRNSAQKPVVEIVSAQRDDQLTYIEEYQLARARKRQEILEREEHERKAQAAHDDLEPVSCMSM